MYMQIPGLKPAYHRIPADAKGLLKSAIRDNNPVVVFESRELSSLVGPVPDGDHSLPTWRWKGATRGKRCYLRRARLLRSRGACRRRSSGRGRCFGRSVDPRSLAPLDTELIRELVRKTRRLVIVDEATPACSVASEIAALVLEDPSTFEALKTPVERVCGVPVPFPYTPVCRLQQSQVETRSRVRFGKCMSRLQGPRLGAPRPDRKRGPGASLEMIARGRGCRWR